MEQAPKAVLEAKNVVDKCAGCVMLGDEIVGHLKKGSLNRTLCKDSLLLFEAR